MQTTQNRNSSIFKEFGLKFETITEELQTCSTSFMNGLNFVGTQTRQKGRKEIIEVLIPLYNKYIFVTHIFYKSKLI